MISTSRSEWPITGDLATLRGCVRAFGARASLSGQRLQDLVFAANEAATNALQHGGGSGTLTAWSDDAGVSLEVADAAGALTEADLSIEPDLVAGRGAGLWMIRRVCEEVGLRGVEGSVRLRLRLHRRGFGNGAAGGGSPIGEPVAA